MCGFLLKDDAENAIQGRKNQLEEIEYGVPWRRRHDDEDIEEDGDSTESESSTQARVDSAVVIPNCKNCWV